MGNLDVVNGGKKIILDHGYVDLVEHWGSDERIIEAARMSTAKGFLGWEDRELWICSACGYKTDDRSAPTLCPNTGHTQTPMRREKVERGDKHLLKFLYANHHMTPFEMAGAVFEIQAPIFVFREWHRHRTQSYNELSGRYTPVPNVNYIPTLYRTSFGAENKQSGRTAEFSPDDAAEWLLQLSDKYEELEAFYQKGLAAGIPKELARIVIPVGRYSRMRASANLRNWLQFLTLRQAPEAQWEIRQYADRVNQHLTGLFPRTMELFNG